MTNPIYDYQHATAVRRDHRRRLRARRACGRAAYDGSYLFGDYICGKIMRLAASGAGYAASDFATGVGPVIDLVFGPYGSSEALYYTVWNGNVWEVRRIAAVSGNRRPAAVAKASPTSGSLPLDVSFDGSASSDPDGDALTYDWNFGDGSPHGLTAKPSHTYVTAGTYTVKLVVNDSHGATATGTVRIDAGNHAPLPRIETPATSTRFKVGQSIVLRASATDTEDGTLPDNRFSWEVDLHHNSHVHPFLAPRTGNGFSFIAPAPENLTAAATSYLEIKLTATDSKGLATTLEQDLRPHLVDLTFTSDPTNLKLLVDGSTLPRRPPSRPGRAMPSTPTVSSRRAEAFPGRPSGRGSARAGE